MHLFEFKRYIHFKIEYMYLELNICFFILNSNAIAFPIKNNSTFSYAKPPSPGGCLLI